MDFLKELRSHLADLDFKRQINFKTVLGASCGLLTSWYVFGKLRDWFRLPPGPIGLPLIGVLPKVDLKNMSNYFKEQCDKNGGICSVYVGTQLFIVLSDFEMIKEMLSQLNYAGRMRNPFIEMVTEGCGVLFAEGEPWSNQRRLALHTLRDMGFAKTASAEVIQQEADRILTQLEEAARSKEGITVGTMLTNATNSVISALTYAERPADNDEDFKKVTDITKGINDQGFFTPPLIFPFIFNFSFLISRLPSAKLLMSGLKFLHSYTLDQINKRKAVMTSEDMEPECVCDSYVLQQLKSEREGDRESFRDLQIIRVCLELFVAGTDTTSRSLEWMLIHMAMFPEIQANVYKEINSTIGPFREPMMSDKMKLPYTCAVIEESLRFASLIPFGVFHRAISSTSFHGYHIPSKAVILPLVYGVNHGAKYWTKPELFDPSRFLSSQGKFQANPHMIAFLVGRRSCLGESLARLEMFLFFTSIMQRFSVSLHPDFVNKKDDILHKGINNGLHFPGAYKLLFKNR